MPSGDNDNCEICKCPLTQHKKNTYGKDTTDGRSYKSKHHYVAKRFLGNSKNRRGTRRSKIFEPKIWSQEIGKVKFYVYLCYDCHEELLHNPVLLPEDIEKLSSIVKKKELNQKDKPRDKRKIAGRIKLFHEIIKKGLEQISQESKP